MIPTNLNELTLEELVALNDSLGYSYVCENGMISAIEVRV